MSTEQGHEDLETLVSGLKAVRETKGFSLKDVHEKTRISVTILDAIEKGQFELLPPGVYARNFIRTYADFLEIDPQPILAFFNEESAPAAPPVLQKDRMEPLPSLQRNWKYAVVGVFLLFSIGILTWFFYSSAGKSLLLPDVGFGEKERPASPGERPVGADMTLKDAPTPPAAAKPLPVTPDTLPPQISAQDPSQVSPPHETGRNAGLYTLIIEAKEKTWLRIRTDGQEATERTLSPGDRLDLSAKDRFALDIGNAAGVRVLFQDRLLENLGGHGQVVHLNLP